MRRCNVIGGLLVFAFLGLTNGNASSLDSLVQNCSREDENSCAKLQKEMQYCKDLSECTSVLLSLPNSTLAKIAADTKTNQRIIDSANELLKKRVEEREAKEAEARAIHDQIRANFSKLREGMSVAEVEAIIGPLIAQASFSSSSIKFADFVEQMRTLEGGEVHYTVKIRGQQVSMDSSLVHGGAPEKSLYTWDSDEFRLVFDHTGKLQEFTYQNPELTPNNHGAVLQQSGKVTLDVGVVLEGTYQFIPGLKLSNFRVYEDGVEQKISDFNPVGAKYELGYRSTNSQQDGAYRKLRVDLVSNVGEHAGEMLRVQDERQRPLTYEVQVPDGYQSQAVAAGTTFPSGNSGIQAPNKYQSHAVAAGAAFPPGNSVVPTDNADAGVAAEHEVSVWKTSTGSGKSSRPQWIVRGVLGIADLPGNFMGSTQSDQADLFGAPEAPGFGKWQFAPEDGNDVCTLESGSARIMGRGALPSPTQFHGVHSQGPSGRAWAIRAGSPGNALGNVVLQPFIYPTSGGGLALGGAIDFIDRGTTSLTMPADPADVTGTIRFPNDKWISVGGGFTIKGGGLEFDETGVFLMPGTQYRKESR